MNKNCYCCSDLKFKDCCEPFLDFKKLPLTPEQLMRSRYTAHCLKDMNYIKKTMRGKALENYNLKESFSHFKKCKWLSLKILNTSVDENKILSYVEFIAEFSLYGKIDTLHEKSEFHFINDHWYYVDGVH